MVLAQEEGFGNECHDDPSYTELYDDLTTFLQKEPLKDGNEWLQKLLRHDKLACRLAAVRIIEVSLRSSPFEPGRPMTRGYYYSSLVWVRLMKRPSRYTARHEECSHFRA